MNTCRGVPPQAPLFEAHSITDEGRPRSKLTLVLTSRYREGTALRALRYFASLAFNVSPFLERIPCAKLAKYRKARGVGWFLRRDALTGLQTISCNV